MDIIIIFLIIIGIELELMSLKNILLNKSYNRLFYIGAILFFLGVFFLLLVKLL